MSAPVFDSRTLRTAYAPPDAPVPAHLLARIDFGLGLQRTDDPRQVVVGLDPLPAAPVTELWLSTLPVRHGWAEGLGYSCNDEVLFGSVLVPEAALADLETAAMQTYVRIAALLRQIGYPHCLRVWNFLAGITAGEGDQERYRLFSAGRARALALQPDFERALPAATAIGMLEPGLVIYFLAGRSPGIPVENPRQVSAFRYPRRYGPKSPSFSRASLVGAGTGARLLVSGTASVVGHESRHPHDARRQLDEAIANVDALLAHTLGTHFPQAPATVVRAESLKLYLRDTAQAAALLQRLQRWPGATGAPLLCLRGEICREDLLLEIEAVYAIDAPL